MIEGTINIVLGDWTLPKKRHCILTSEMLIISKLIGSKKKNQIHQEKYALNTLLLLNESEFEMKSNSHFELNSSSIPLLLSNNQTLVLDPGKTYSKWKSTLESKIYRSGFPVPVVPKYSLIESELPLVNPSTVMNTTSFFACSFVSFHVPSPFLLSFSESTLFHITNCEGPWWKVEMGGLCGWLPYWSVEKISLSVYF